MANYGKSGLGLLISLWAYGMLATLTERTDLISLFSYYSLAFVGVYLLYQSRLSFRWLLGLGLVFRLFYWGDIPVLSQDFYRFLWDGQLQMRGINPYSVPPLALEALHHFPGMGELYAGMGALSQEHYSNYPPMSQMLYALAAFIGGSSILAQVNVLRVIVIAGDLLGAVGLKKLLHHFRLPKHQLTWYYLNPLLIVEGTGNLHGEGLMMGVVAWGLWLYCQKRWVWSGMTLALSVAIKLVPLLWLPLLLRQRSTKEALLLIGSGSGLSSLLWGGYLPWEAWEHYQQTLQLWFSNFEFNASWYYLIREWGYQQTGYNIIRKLGKITPWIMVGLVVLFTLWPQRDRTARKWELALGLLSLYYFTATTVHPWYVIHLLFLGTLTIYRYPILWSYTVILSYSAYGVSSVEEPHWLVWVEYLPVYGLLFWEWRRRSAYTAAIQKL